jgi:transposase-like protein
MVKNMNKQKSYTNEFKFKVAVEMIKGDLTIAEIISKYQAPRSVLSKWKKQLLDNGSEIYKKGTTYVAFKTLIRLKSQFIIQKLLKKLNFYILN